MKAMAARTRDVDDLRHLAELADVTSAEDAIRLCERFFPGEEISPRARAILTDLFG
ncbi:hypothetical protein [Sphaerimonospora thailandensis]|uniref:hypothetical protein n=1 Tax=Sphaerimonospora thailandensis TaxID=795644 RepID=UPI001950F634|nr:hypothetical protein [Sphaerimonospora thailandensis]